MSFAENLKRIRKKKRLSQEELAEILGVSRQAVSKWEQGLGYPEVDKLLLLSHELNISLDSLMATEIAQEKAAEPDKVTGKIIITSPHEHVIVECCNVFSSPKFKGKNCPQYALFTRDNAASFWGTQSIFLGWYANEELLNKEVSEIQNAIFQGMPSYELKYSVKVERKLFSVRVLAD